MGDVPEQVRQQLVQELEQPGSILCDCPPREEDTPVSPRTGEPMDHHCDCQAVRAAAILLGADSLTSHAKACGHGTRYDEFYTPRAGQAATPDGPRRWAHHVPAEPGPDVLAVQIVETGQRWERRYAKDQPDRWAWGHWLLEWSQLLSAWAVGHTLTDATPAADGQDGRDG
jgi:hypothetical protein